MMSSVAGESNHPWKNDCGKASRFKRWLACVSSVILGAALMALVPAFADEVPGFGPEEPAIHNEFAEIENFDLQTYTVTLKPNGGGGTSTAITTDTGTITLPDPDSIGFTAPVGATFVGWSTDRTGRNNVYSQEVVFPDNTAHTAVLNRDTTLYAIWLQPGQADSGVTAYFYIRADGTIPFEPSQGAKSDYIPRASATTLAGSLCQPVAVTNNVEVVEQNLSQKPSDADLIAALDAEGVSFDPTTEKIVWYVIKARQSGGDAWNVDGVIVPRTEHMVYYNPNGGNANVPPAKAYLENASVSVDFSVIPVRPGYDFLGWADSASATAADYPNGQAATFTMPDEDKHLYAVWSPRFVEFIYEADPAEGGTLTVHVNTVRAYDGDGITGSVATPAKGYLFEGWYKGDEAVSENADLDHEAILSSANRLHGAFDDTTYTARFVRAEASMSAAKVIANAPANGEYFVEGEVISFQVTVTNAGNTPLSGVTVNDTMSGLHELGALAPGQSQSGSYDHTVTAEDVERGYVSNEAAINAEAEDGLGNPVPVPEQVVGTGALTGVPPADETYVLYGAYPEDGGSVGQNYEIVDANTADGLTDRTAVAQAGYHFAGWYEDDVLISNEATLTADEMLAVLNQHAADGTRAVYAPTLFIAHFVADDAEPDNPDGPVEPSGPTDPSGPDTPDVPDKPTGPVVGPGASGGTTNPGGTTNGANGGQSYITEPPEANDASLEGQPMVQAGDSTAKSVIGLGLIALAAVVLALVSRRKSEDA